MASMNSSVVSALLALLISTGLFVGESDAWEDVCKNMQTTPFSTNSTVMRHVHGTSSPYRFRPQGKINLQCCFKSQTIASPFQISWYHYNKQIALVPNSLEDGFAVQRLANTTVVTCSTIWNYGVGEKNAGIYTCKAEDGLANRSICVKYNDDPQYAPQVEAVEKRVRVTLHSNVTLSCTLTNVRNDKDFRDWYFSNKTLKSVGKDRPKVDNGPYVMDLNLTIVNVTEEKLGEYICWAQNNLGKDEDTMMLELETGPSSQKPSVRFIESPTAPPPKNTNILVAVAVLGSVFAVVLLLGVYKCEKKRRRLMLTRNMHRLYEQGPQGSFQYDLFLSCSSENGTFAQEYLLPLLESPPYNLKVCYHHRDFELGRDVLQNMADAVYKSCKILIIISDNYLTSEYCKYEMDAALYRQLNENDPCVALIRCGAMNKKLPQTLKAKNFLDLTNNMEQSHMEKRLKTFVKDICRDMKDAMVCMENSPA